MESDSITRLSFPLKTNTDRRRDNLITLRSKDCTNIELRILIKAFDTTPGYGEGTIIDIIVHDKTKDYSLVILLFSSLLKEITPSKPITKFLSEHNCYRFIYTLIDLDHDDIIEIFKHAKDSDHYSKTEPGLQEKAVACKNGLLKMRQSVQSEGNASKEDGIMSELQKNGTNLFEWQTDLYTSTEEPETSDSDETYEPEEQRETTKPNHEPNGPKSSVKISKSNINEWIITHTAKKRQTHSDRQTCTQCSGTGFILRSTSDTSKRGPGTTTEIPDPTGQQLRREFRGTF